MDLVPFDDVIKIWWSCLWCGCMFSQTVDVKSDFRDLGIEFYMNQHVFSCKGFFLYEAPPKTEMLKTFQYR